MGTIRVEDLESALADALRRVELGESITILRDGQPLARLCPPDEPGLHVGERVGSKSGLRPMGRKLTGGAYLRALADDRDGDDR